jgi:hypothetical protein
VAGLGRFLSSDNASIPRLHRVIRRRKEVERAQANGDAEPGGRPGDGRAIGNGLGLQHRGGAENGSRAGHRDDPVAEAIARLREAVQEAVSACEASRSTDPIDVPKS